MHHKTSKPNLMLVASILFALMFAPLLIRVAHADENPPTPLGEPDHHVYLPVFVEDTLEAVENLAASIVAEKYQIPLERLKIVSSAQADYPLQELQTNSYKVMDLETGAIYPVALGPGSELLDPEALDAAEEAAYLNRYGKLEPELAEMLAAGTLEDTTRLVIWLKEPPHESLPRPEINRDENDGMQESLSAAQQEEIQRQQDAYFAQLEQERAEFVAALAQPVLERLNAMGYEASADTTAPLLTASLPVSAIRTVQNWEEVDQIYLDRKPAPALASARQAILAHTVNNRTQNGYNITGRGVKVAVIEVSGRIATDNPYLSGVINDTTNTCPYADDHATEVTGIIRSTDSFFRGIAPEAIVRVGGGCAPDYALVQAATNRAVNWGAKIFNVSLGHDSARRISAVDRFYDTVVFKQNRTVVIAAGNAAPPCGTTSNVISPALSYNAISVGNFDHMASATWSDDVMGPCSSYLDPISRNKDREKPEVSAPGSYLYSTITYDPWIGYIGFGTSYAAPMVAGTTALLVQRDPMLAYNPEAIKAILMTTAVNNIEGGSKISEKDGAGGIAANRADDVARRVSGDWGMTSYSCTTASPRALTSMYLQAGVRTRAVIAWNTDPAFSDYANRPSADLDLTVKNSSGIIVASSASYDNTFEIVDFIPSTSGFYRLIVTKASCSLSPGYVGWAWRRGS